MNDNRPPWREPMVWLVVGLPMASVIAGIGLLVIASSTGSTDAVADPVRRTAQVQVADLGPDALAQRMRLSAVLRIDDGGFVQLLPVNGDFDRSASLRIDLRHPVRADLDRRLLLQPDEMGWRSAAKLDNRHDWNVQLSPQDGGWRLQGRVPKGMRAAHLHPALSER